MRKRLRVRSISAVESQQGAEWHQTGEGLPELTPLPKMQSPKKTVTTDVSSNDQIIQFVEDFADYVAQVNPSFCNEFLLPIENRNYSNIVGTLVNVCVNAYPNLDQQKSCFTIFSKEEIVKNIQPKSCSTQNQPTEKKTELYEIFQPKVEEINLQGIPEENYVLEFIKNNYGERFPDPKNNPDAFAKACKKACKKSDKEGFSDFPFKVTCGDRWEEFTWCSDPNNIDKIAATLIDYPHSYSGNSIARCDPNTWRTDNCEFKK